MNSDLTPEQIEQLKSLGIAISESTQNISKEIKRDTISSPNIGQISPTPKLSTPSHRLLPLLSISGLTLISFGGLVLFKQKSTTVSAPQVSSPVQNPQGEVGPTQVPKSIQHYLLTSQQYFTEALTAQGTNNTTLALENLNQAIISASSAIDSHPEDYRGYEQRGRIYQSVISSQPQTLPLAIADFTKAAQLNPDSAEITRTLANLYAQQGNAQGTIEYLAKTVSLEPTKPQNFYDLAKIQQQIGQLPAALDTYNRLITILSDPTQKAQVEKEKIAIENLISQTKNSPNSPNIPSTNPNIPTPPPIQTEGATIQANNGQGLVIAAPETSKDISVSNLVDSNSLSGTATLSSGQSQVTITNSQITKTSTIYLTTVKGGKNLSLQVLSKSDGSFVAGLDSTAPESIEFKYWIIK